MPIIKINDGKELFCETGANLLDVFRNANVFIENPCNGKGTCGKCKVKLLSGGFSAVHPTEEKLLTPEEISAGVRLSCMTEVLGDGSIELLQKERRHSGLTEGYLPEFTKDKGSGYGIALDIGTTTLALSLVNLEDGREMAQTSAINPQKQFGLDVLTRISYEYEKGEAAIAELQNVLVQTLNEKIQQLCEMAAVSNENINEIVVAANCAMTHMLLGADARPMGKSPYQPQFTEAQELLAREIGFEAGEQTKLFCLPQVSAFIGGDIVAGACVCQLHEAKKTVLFIDIGTNGEIILVHDGEMLSCSCAAGPALEGMNIRCGMRAEEGAVEDVSIGEKVQLKTIGDTTPAGLCGSGILAAVRELLKSGFLKKTGAFVAMDKAPLPGLLRLNGTKREAILCGNPEIIVTQDDVRQVQLAKGAIRSGFTVLLNEANITMEKVDKVIIAGQFGAHLPVDSLIGIGLLPECLRHKLTYVGNSSKTGACMALLSREKRQEMKEIAKKINYIELAETKDYERVFAESMSFEQK